MTTTAKTKATKRIVKSADTKKYEVRAFNGTAGPVICQIFGLWQCWLSRKFATDSTPEAPKYEAMKSPTYLAIVCGSKDNGRFVIIDKRPAVIEAVETILAANAEGTDWFEIKRLIIADLNRTRAYARVVTRGQTQFLVLTDDLGSTTPTTTLHAMVAAGAPLTNRALFSVVKEIDDGFKCVVIAITDMDNAVQLPPESKNGKSLILA